MCIRPGNSDFVLFGFWYNFAKLVLQMFWSWVSCYPFGLHFEKYCILGGGRKSAIFEMLRPFAGLTILRSQVEFCVIGLHCLDKQWPVGEGLSQQFYKYLGVSAKKLGDHLNI